MGGNSSLSILFGLLLGTAVCAAPQPVSFEMLSDNYLEAYFRVSPSTATSDGIHRFDAELEDLSVAANRARVAELNRFLTEFGAVDASKLEAGTQADRELVLSAIRAELLSRETVRYWQINPDLYSSTASNSIYVIMSRNFAPAQERLKSVIARERKFSDLFRTARQNLKNPPRVFTEVALEQLPGIISFFKKDVPLAFQDVKGPVAAEFKKTNQAAIATLASYRDYLRAKVLPKSHGDFRLGADTFAKKLKYEEMVEIPLADLLQIGMTNLRDNQKRLAEAVAKIDSHRPMSEVLTQLSKDHPAPDHLLQNVRDLLGSLRQFIADKHIVTIPSQVEPTVQETPPFMRALTFASMDTPGPFETVAKEAFYNITLPEPTWTKEHVEEHMEGYNRGTIVATSIHEAYPGHYVQFQWVNAAKLSKLRKVLGANSNDEGWAHYTEQMLLDEGYGNGDWKLRAGQLVDALLRDCRYIVGIQMHTGKMSFEQGVDFFVKQGHLSRANAEVETKRGTSDPTYLYYTLGKLEIFKLRDDYKTARGDKFSLQEFHDSFLKEGFPPIKLVRRLMLGNDSPVL